MNKLGKQMWIALALMLGMASASIASATVVMTFDELNPVGEYVNDFYNGGCGSLGTCGGPDYGVTWSDNTLAGGAPNGAWSNTANSPSSPNVIDFTSGVAAYMNVAAGFDTGFSFYYAATNTAGEINVYSGLNGTGSLLATLGLPTLGSRCDGFTEDYSCWAPIGVSFSGTAMSVGFGGTLSTNQGLIVFDNVTIGSTTPTTTIPEPAVLSVFGLGLLLIGLFTGLRRRVA